MFTPEDVASFHSVARSLREKAVLTAQREVSLLKSSFMAKGMLNSSRAALEIDLKVAELLEIHARELFDAQSQLFAHAATDDDCAQLENLLHGEITLLGAALGEISTSEAGRIMAALSSKWEAAQTTNALARALSEFPSRARLASSAAVSIQKRSSASGTSYNFNGPVGSIQQGNYNTANIQQQQSQTYSSEQLLEAIERLMAELRNHRNTEEALEALENVRSEVNKPQPNRITVKGIISGLKDIVETLKAAPEAWNTIQGWSNSIGL